jgi:hypothetical protein
VLIQSALDAEALRLSKETSEKKKLTAVEFKGPENWVPSHISFCDEIRNVVGASDMLFDWRV